MKLSKNIISRICIILLILFSFFIALRAYNNAASFLFSLFLGVSITILPLLLSLTIGRIKRYLFHYSLWTIILLIVGFLIWIQTLPDSTNSETPKWVKAAARHFRDKAGIFTRYNVAATLTEYKNNYTDSEYYIVKIIYIRGAKELKNYYLGKVEINHSYQLQKEIYDEQAIYDTLLLKTEFGHIGSLYSDIKQFETAKGYR